jgi:hypothetical protein
MESTLNPQHEEAHFPVQNEQKSELMQTFEQQVTDMHWAYRDLLKAIFEGPEENQAAA